MNDEQSTEAETPEPSAEDVQGAPSGPDEQPPEPTPEENPSPEPSEEQPSEADNDSESKGGEDTEAQDAPDGSALPELPGRPAQEATNPKVAPPPPPSEQPGVGGPANPEPDPRLGPLPNLDNGRIGAEIDAAQARAEEHRQEIAGGDGDEGEGDSEE